MGKEQNGNGAGKRKEDAPRLARHSSQSWEDHHVGAMPSFLSRSDHQHHSASSRAMAEQKEQSLLDLIDRCDNFTPHSSQQQETLVPFRISPSSNSPALGLIRPQVLEQISKDIASSPSLCPFRINNSNNNPNSNCLHFIPELDSPALRTQALATYLQTWHSTGLFPDQIGGRLWRDELYDVYASPFGPRRISSKPPSAYTVSDEELKSNAGGDLDLDLGERNYVFSMERTAGALFGVVTYGVHMTVYEQDGPLPTFESLRMWVPRRSATKQTYVAPILIPIPRTNSVIRWPLHLDNSVAGGIPTGLSSFESIVKESSEEASLPEEFTRKWIRHAGCISYFSATRMGWLYPEVQYLYDLRLTETEGEERKVVLKPFDTEVDSFEVRPFWFVLPWNVISMMMDGFVPQLMPLDKVLHHMRAGEFKPNCAIGSSSPTPSLLPLPLPLTLSDVSVCECSDHRIPHPPRPRHGRERAPLPRDLDEVAWAVRVRTVVDEISHTDE